MNAFKVKEREVGETAVLAMTLVMSFCTQNTHVLFRS